MDRRDFFKNITVGSAGIILFPSFMDGSGRMNLSEPGDLESMFLDPPDSAGPWVCWQWLNGNVTREGITLDLEAMKRMGISGAICFNSVSGIPRGLVDYGSEAWMDATEHAVKEAARLGLGIMLHNSPGYSGTGGSRTIPEMSMQQLVWTETPVNHSKKLKIKLPQPLTRMGYFRDAFVLAFPSLPAEPGLKRENLAAVDPGLKNGMEFHSSNDPDSMIDLTPLMNKKGVLKWNPPTPFDWTVLRFGHTVAGEESTSYPDAGKGLEIDKFRKEALDFQLAQFNKNVTERLKPWIGKSFTGFTSDCWEADKQNWCIGFDLEFEKRRGYSLKPWMPVLTGRIMGSEDQTKRFLWDILKTQTELVSANYYGHWKEWCYQNGLLYFTEPYGEGNPDSPGTGQQPDVPKVEFRTGYLYGSNVTSKQDASLTHVYGEQVAAAEAFTGMPATSGSTGYPYTLKAEGDWFYTLGINRLIFNVFVHQPYTTGFPGMTAGPYRVHFDRNNTWTEKANGWIDYLRRTQFILQQGLTIADICYFMGDEPQSDVPDIYPLLPEGYAFDVIGTDALFNRFSVHNGKIELPDGMCYRLCIMAPVDAILPATLKRLTELTKQGMALMVQSKPLKSPGLSGSGDEVLKLTEHLYGNLDGNKIRQVNFGEGKVYWGMPLNEVLEQLQVRPDLLISAENQNAAIHYIHKTLNDREVYFISNQRRSRERITCSFRIINRLPEIWNGETGEIYIAPLFENRDDRLWMPLELDPAGSLFVIFRKAGDKALYKRISEDDKILIDSEKFKNPGTAGIPDILNNFTVSLWPKPDTYTPLSFHSNPDGKLTGLFLQNGIYKILTTNENAEEVATFYMDGCFEIALESSWEVQFPTGNGTPDRIEIPELISLIRHEDFNIRHFSGTCRYRTVFYLVDSDFTGGRMILVDLGRVEVIAGVFMNGKDAGRVWKEPYLVNVSPYVKKGENILEVEVTNLWHNRLIGDENLPAENEYSKDGFILKLPEWYVKNQPKPGERITFSVRHDLEKTDPLLESGLLGPVKLIMGEERML
jgi:hypothetical protein